MAASRSHLFLATLCAVASGACSLIVSLDGLAGAGAPTADAETDADARADAAAARDTSAGATDAPADVSTETATPADASVAIRPIQFNGAVLYTSSTNYKCSFMAPVTTGNALVVAFNWSPGSALASVADSQGNDYLPAVTNGTSAIYFVKSAKGGSVQVSVSFTVATGGVLFVHEYEGLDPNQPLDQTNGASGTTEATSSGPVTTVAANELIFSFARSDTGLDPTPTPGFESRVTPMTGGGQMSEDRIALSTGTFRGDYTRLAGQGTWTALISTFRGIQ